MSSVVYMLNLSVQLLISVFFIDQVLVPKKSFIFRFLVWYIPYSMWHLFCNYFTYFNISGAVQTFFEAVIITYIFFFYEGKLRKKIFVWSFYILYSALLEIMATYGTCLLFGVHIEDFYEYGDKNIYVSSARVIYADIMFAIVILFTVIYRRKELLKKRNIADFAMMFGFNIIHMIFLCLYYTSNKNELDENDNIIQIVFQTLFFIMLFIQYSNTLRIRKYAENELEFSELKNKMDSTYNYYTLAEEKLDEISLIRHDIRNQFDTVRKLIESPDSQNEALNILDELSSSLDSMKIVNYCENHTVNAVLTLKINDKKYHSISTEVILHDIDKLPFTDYEICSIMSNLYDNAAEACLMCENPEERFIDIRCGLHGDYCILKFENSMSQENLSTVTSKKEAGHGYGLKIIEKTCRKYNGEFSIKNADGTVKSTLIIPVCD